VTIEFRISIASDIETLVSIRIASMKESLENIGRFDPQRARERLVENFRPEDTTLVIADGKVIGFYATLQQEHALKLEHFYIDPAYQGQGIGRVALDRVKGKAQENSQEIILLALKGSKANLFYTRNGFIQYGEEAFDNLYRWNTSI
jgi:GNAT superfamily N-acetyltransferase